ncbi:MAG: low affinity iron permease family protein [Hyphomicrobiaceae bacterium]
MECFHGAEIAKFSGCSNGFRLSHGGRRTDALAGSLLDRDRGPDTPHVELVINTATTVLTLLAVFLIQHKQNRGNLGVQLQLDELIKTSKEARNCLIDLEHCSDEEIQAIQMGFDRRAIRNPLGETAE